MKHKTPLYIDNSIIRDIKKILINLPGENITSIVNSSLKEYLKKAGTGRKMSNILKAKNSINKDVFGDSVKYQRKLRAEWDDK